MVERAQRTHDRAADFHRRDCMSAAATNSTRSSSAGKLDAAARQRDAAASRAGAAHERHEASTFTAGLIQMRSGLTPAANLDAAVTPDRRGARRRRRLCADAGDDQHPGSSSASSCSPRSSPEDSDATLAALSRACAQARHLSSMSARWRSRLSPEKAANRSFLIDRRGEIVARYDKIHMFDVDLAGGESYREFAQLPAGRDRRRSPTCPGAGLG